MHLTLYLWILTGSSSKVGWETRRVVLSGSFNPLHDGHIKLLDAACRFVRNQLYWGINTAQFFVMIEYCNQVHSCGDMLDDLAGDEVYIFWIECGTLVFFFFFNSLREGGLPCYEMSAINADKPPMVLKDVLDRLKQFRTLGTLLICIGSYSYVNLQDSHHSRCQRFSKWAL